MLLAVDLGLRTGFALWDRDGRLVSYRSQNFGSRPRLKKGALSVLRGYSGVTHLLVEGSGELALAWENAAIRARIPVRIIDAHVWRERLLLPRDRRKGVRAKEKADDLARRVIDWSQAPRPTSLRHDAAEAIVIGLWGVLELGWLASLPHELRP